MRLAIVSDAHLLDPGSRRQAAFISLLDGLDAERLVLLGDIFHAWGGEGTATPPGVAGALAAFARLADRGVPVTFVPGNHELQAGPHLESTLGWAVRGPHPDTSTGATLLLAHGDEAERRFGYRAVRATLRSRPFTSALRGLGPHRSQALLERLAGSAVAFEGRDARLVAQQRAWAARALGQGADAVVMGHSHIAGLVDTDRGLVVHTGAWAGLRTWVLVGGGALRLMRARSRGHEVLDARAWPPPARP